LAKELKKADLVDQGMKESDPKGKYGWRGKGCKLEDGAPALDGLVSNTVHEAIHRRGETE